MAQIETWFEQDLKKPVKVTFLDGNVFSADNDGNKVGVKVYSDGEPVTITGTISGNVIRPDGTTVAVTGSSSGNSAWIVLPQAAYTYPGVVSIIIKNTVGSAIATLCAVVATVYESTTSVVVDPGTIIPSIETLITSIQTAVASIPADYSSLWTSLAPAFDSTKSYVAGQYVTYNGGVYRFITTHSGSWVAADAVAVNIGGELSNLNDALSDNAIFYLFPGKITPGGYFDKRNTDCAITENSNWGTTDKIKIAGGTCRIKNVSTVGTNPVSVYYDENQNYIGYFSPTSAWTVWRTLTPPENAVYVAFSLHKSDFALFKCEVDFVSNKLTEVNELEQTCSRIVPGKTDEIWSWWIYPQAVSFQRVRNNLYWGYTSADGRKGIGKYDFDNGEINKHNLYKISSVDDHNGVAVYVYDDGTIICAYATGHNTDNYMHIRRSIVPETIETFTEDLPLLSANKTSYAQLIYSSGRLYLFYRSGTSTWAYRYTTNKGVTWSDEVILVTSSVQYYCLFRPTTTTGIIRVLMQSNTQLGAATDTNIRQAFFHTDTNTLYDSDNTTILGASSIDKDNITIIIANTENLRRQRLLDAAITEPIRPLILYAPYNDITSFSDAVYMLYDSGTTHEVNITGLPIYGTYFLGASFIDSENIIVDHGTGSNNGMDILTIYFYDGNTVTSQGDIYSEQRSDIPIRNARPIADINGRAILWQRGKYSTTSYTDFNTDAKIYLLSTGTVI